eukprot:TRINITY_DN4077_c0_g1_i1.p1 TRINITY_DN4077_c0_g1~~TRINITY_DN4077_c0_g1_i1.p1  ORF type:complete len:216 (-),score=54.22 TRINITY_DN4077_c0_g1_i1:493-1140(-)
MSNKAEIAFREQQLETDLQRVQQLIHDLPTSNNRDEDAREVEDIFRTLEIVIGELDVEIQQLGQSERRQFIAKSKDFAKRIQESQTDFKLKQSNSTKDELLGDHTVTDEKTADLEALKDNGKKHMDDTLTSLQRSVDTMSKTKEVAVSAAEQLHHQQHQLEVFADDLKNIGTTLSRANDIVRAMARRVLCDKYIWVLVFLIVAAIIGILIYKKMH